MMSNIQRADPSRLLPFKGASNFRDLGGYPATGGRSVKWGVLYRTGHLAKLRDSDLPRFEQLGIHTLIDFRSSMERERYPDRLPPEHHIRILSLPVLDKDNEMVYEISQRVKKNDFSGYHPNDKMGQAYRQFVTHFTHQYRQFLHAVLAAEGAPVLWHCTVGKDRAGFAAALILRLLGVPQPIVMYDYMLSANYLKPRRSLLLLLRLTKGIRASRTIRSLMEVKERWLQGAFQTIDEHWGSFENYVAQALELSPTDIAKLRQTLLEHTHS